MRTQYNKNGRILWLCFHGFTYIYMLLQIRLYRYANKIIGFYQYINGSVIILSLVIIFMYLEFNNVCNLIKFNM